MSKIDRFRGEHNFLSNFHSHGGLIAIPFDVEKVLFFNHVEGAYQSMKCLVPKDRQQFVGLLPVDAKRLGKQVLKRDDWQEIKIGVMQNCLAQKFRNNLHLCDKLLATDYRELIEGNDWHDNFWGNCDCDDCAEIEGENHLGKLLMELRERFSQN